MKGELDKAIADYTSVIELDPNNGEAFRGRGRAQNVMTPHAHPAHLQIAGEDRGVAAGKSLPVAPILVPYRRKRADSSASESGR